MQGERDWCYIMLVSSNPRLDSMDFLSSIDAMLGNIRVLVAIPSKVARTFSVAWMQGGMGVQAATLRYLAFMLGNMRLQAP